MALKFLDTATATTGANPGPASIVTIGGVTYLFAGNGTSSNINGYRVGEDGSLTSLGAPTSGPLGVSQMAVSSTGGQTYLQVVGFASGGSMATYAIAPNGSLVAVGGPISVGFRPTSVASVVVNGQTFVYAGSHVDDQIKAYSVGVGGALSPVLGGTVAGSAASFSSATVGGTTFLFTAGLDDDRIRAFSINADGTLAATPTNVVDNASLLLDGVASIATAVVGGTAYLFAGSYADDGISVFAIGNGGTLTNVHNVSDLQSADFKLDGVVSVTTQVINGVTYLFATGQVDDGVTVFSVSAAGQLTFAGSIGDEGSRKLDGATGLATTVIGGTAFLFATGQFEDGVSGFRIRDNSLDDTYLVQTTSDVVDELGGGGTDLVLSTITFSLSDSTHVFGDVENLTLLGAQSLSATGNALGNVLSGNDGANLLDGLSGNDLLVGGIGADTLLGGEGADVLRGGLGKDSMDGGSGADVVDYSDRSAAVSVTLKRAKEIDVKVGGAAEDRMQNVEGVVGGFGKDKLTGDSKANYFAGNGGTDTLSGADGNDSLAGGLRQDRLEGGAGRDWFIFDSALGRNNVDRVVDFRTKADKIVLNDLIFASIGPALSKAEFYAAAGARSAHDKNDRIVYDTDSGKLYYDVDGKGGQAAKHFATLIDDPSVRYSDVLIV